MTNKVRDLWNHVNDIYMDTNWSSVNQKEEYADEIYSRILSMAKHCLTIIENEDDFHITAPSIIRSLIEGAVELENLRCVNFYEKYLELISRREEYQFVKNYNESFMDYVSNERDYSAKYESNIEKEGYFNLKREVYRLLNVGQDVNIFSVSFKFSLLSNESNEKRHIKYRMFYDLLCAHSHHNLRFISKKGLKKVADIRAFKLFYLDLIGSILKNGLINLFNIFDDSIDKKDFKQLKQLKKSIMENKKNELSISDLFREFKLLYDFD